MPSRPRVAVVGQVPPPVHGQAVMIEALLAGDGGPVERVHVPMRFSDGIGDVGRARAGKLAELVRVIGGVWRARLGGARVLYYPPAGPSLVPILRDVVLLSATRWAFSGVAYHFHAGGLAERLDALPVPLRWLARAAYGRPDLAVRPAASAPRDGAALGAARDAVVPYGIVDPWPDGPPARDGRDGRPVRLLSVGSIRESKGADVLLDAVGRLRDRGLDVTVSLVGGFASAAGEARLRARAAGPDLAGAVRFPGVLTGVEKWAAFAEADVFCFPTFYEAETFGLVAVEAMASGLPVVATRWRGVPDVVGPTGVLVEPRDAGALADALGPLVRDAKLRQTVGAAGRARFERRFTADRYRAEMWAALAALAPSPPERQMAGRTAPAPA